MTRIADNLQTVVDFIRDVKPFHTKIYEIQLIYQLNDAVSLDISDSHSIDGTLTVDYSDEVANLIAGWDCNPWDELWKYGTIIQQPIIEINPVDRYISFVGDATYSFSMDAYSKGVTPVDVTSFDPITGIFELGRAVPWETGFPVVVESSLLYPSPIVADVTYYTIVDSPSRVRLATSKARAIAGISIEYNNYAAGNITIRALQHPVLVTPTNHTVYVVGTDYDISTNRTKIFLSDESFIGLEYGLVDILVESTWDNPDVTSLELSASYTTVQTIISEHITFDYTDFRFNDLIGVGPVPPTNPLEPWGGDSGECIVSPQAIQRDLRKFVVEGDWRYYASAELSSDRSGSFRMLSYNQPSLNIRVESHMYIEPTDVMPGYTEFTLVDMPTEFTVGTQLTLYTNDQFTRSLSLVNAYWDRVWDRYPNDETTADTMISESIQIMVDQGSIPIGSASWDGDRWDYVGFDQELVY